MGFITRLTLLSVVASGAGLAYYNQNYVYEGHYYEKNPFQSRGLIEKVKHKLIGLNDDITQAKVFNTINPNKNDIVVDFYEKQLDTERTKKILAKYKTRDEILLKIQSATFQSPVFFVHKYLISTYLKNQKDGFNRVAGFTDYEPVIEDPEKLPKLLGALPLMPKVDQLKYVWSNADVAKQTTIFKPNTIIFGMFNFVGHGSTSNGGFLDFTFGNKFVPLTALHRAEYKIVKNYKGEDNLVVRFASGNNVLEKGGVYTDETKGLHEWMTRVLVLNAISELEN